MMIADYLREILKPENENNRRRFLIFTFTFLLLPVAIFFIFKGIQEHRWVYVGLLSIITIVNLLNLSLIRKHLRLSSFILIISAFIFILYLFIFSPDYSVILWFYLLIPAAVSIIGYLFGGILALLTITTIGLLYFIKPEWLNANYDTGLIVRFMITFVIITLFASMGEYTRKSLQREYLEKIDELELKNSELAALEEELRQSFDELKAINENLVNQRKIVERQNQLLRQYKTAIEQTSVMILFFNKKKIITYANPAFLKITGFNKKEIIGQNIKILASHHYKPELFQKSLKLIESGKTWSGEAIMTRKNKKPFISKIVVSPIKLNSHISGYVAMMHNITKEKILEIKNKKQHLKLKSLYKDLKDSLNFAKNIVSNLFSYDLSILNFFSEYFILSKPRDIVSGDFYYFDKSNTCLIIGLADCTGHGVPAAFISILGFTLLNDTLKFRKVCEPDKVLEILREEFIKIFKEEFIGMDMGLCILHLNTMELQFAGANNRMYLIRNNQLIEFKGIRAPIGKHLKTKKFIKHTIKLNKGDIFYLFTDGYYDQLGYDQNGRISRFYSKNFKKLISQIAHKSLKEQYQILLNNFIEWKKDLEQTDDVTILAFKV